jgi:eukaryotic-like serine/threonine-protein kinase
VALLEPGLMIRDTYEVERFLGEGAFAEVYRVRHRFLGRQALKVFKRSGMSREDTQEMLGEAILLSRIGHPNIVRVFDANVLDLPLGQHGYFTMEHVPGGSLRKFWQSHGQGLVPVAIVLDLIRQVCRGIAVAHSEHPPIIHRDIKPDNILVGYESEGLRARVGDFGLAKSVNPLTLLATTAGTVSFKPPEAFLDKKSDSCASDVWAIGATLYMLLTDRLPENSATAKVPQGLKPLIPPSRLNPEADTVLDGIVAKALSGEPAARYRDARELLGALDGWKPAYAAGPAGTKHLSSEPSKFSLDGGAARDSRGAQELVTAAEVLAKAGRLSEAADTLEEAFNKSPSLRDRYAEKVRLWRCGISM